MISLAVPSTHYCGVSGLFQTPGGSHVLPTHSAFRYQGMAVSTPLPGAHFTGLQVGSSVKKHGGREDVGQRAVKTTVSQNAPSLIQSPLSWTFFCRCSFSFLFFVFFLAALGLRWCTWAFSSCNEQGLLLTAEHGL